jgi:methyltransferase (TIGR00027 family)
MKQSGNTFEPSRTAQWVAAARTVGKLLPRDLLLAHDPYGVGFAEGRTRMLAESLLEHPRIARALITRAGPLTGFLLWMQLRTRALDDVLLEFIQNGGRQVVLLGAGFDSRALRFRRELADAHVYEIDHPATQAGKHARLPSEAMRTRVVYVGWDFEQDDMAKLPARLHAQGLDSEAPVLTIWEGVTMYLAPEAIEATVAAVRAWGSSGSLLALTYVDRAALESKDREVQLLSRIVARVGEPWRFGWHPRDLPAWFRERGYDLVSDVTAAELAAHFYPPRWHHHFQNPHRRIAVLRTQ